MRRMDRIDEDDRFVDADRVEQVLVFVDESLLLGVVEAARHPFRLAIDKAQTMQQSDQPGAAVAQPECPLQPGPDDPGAARTMGADPIAQSDFLLAAQVAATAFVTEGLQPFDAAALKCPKPVANRIVVQQQSCRDAFAVPAPIEKNDGVGSAGDAMLLKPIPRNLSQGLPVGGCKKSAANHPSSRISSSGAVK